VPPRAHTMVSPTSLRPGHCRVLRKGSQSAVICVSCASWRAQCIALQRVYCNTLRHVVTRCNAQQHTLPGSSHLRMMCCVARTVQCVVACLLQHTATRCDIPQYAATHCNTLQHTATHCNTLQHAATHCNTLHHTATLYNTLQHTAANCNIRTNPFGLTH